MQTSDFRCKSCGKLLFKGEIISGTINLKCTKCGLINNFVGCFNDKNGLNNLKDLIAKLENK